MRWRKWSVLSWIGGWLLLTSCSLLPHKPDEPFVCDIRPAYTETGHDDTDNYRVNRACLRGVNERLKACYRE